MRLWWFILFLSSFVFSQQEIEICGEENVSFTYSTLSTEPGNNEWEVNGQYFYSESLNMSWSDTGTYVINVIRYNDGCPSLPQTLTVKVTKCEDPIYWVPNAFTPDGDDYNQSFTPIFTSGVDPYDYHLMVFNRWGELLFESYDMTKGWNGKYGGISCQDGVYTWKIEFKVLKNDEHIMKFGHVVLVK
jgi:gliding motility-associated-like protein